LAGSGSETIYSGSGSCKKFRIRIHNTAIYISLASIKDVHVTEEAFSPQKRTSALQNMKLLNFFSTLWVIFALLDPDPDSESGYGSTDLIRNTEKRSIFYLYDVRDIIAST
jgi:hypothetical protein